MTDDRVITVRLTVDQAIVLRTCATGELERMTEMDSESAYAQSLERGAEALLRAVRRPRSAKRRVRV